MKKKHVYYTECQACGAGKRRANPSKFCHRCAGMAAHGADPSHMKAIRNRAKQVRQANARMVLRAELATQDECTEFSRRWDQVPGFRSIPGADVAAHLIAAGAHPPARMLRQVMALAVHLTAKQ